MNICDYSFSRPNPAALKAAGIDGVIRYATGVGKGISRDEYNILVAAGLTVTLVQEGGNQPALGGFNAGVRDALVANAAGTAVGYPADCTIFYVAEDPARLPDRDWPTVDAYFAGVASVPGRPVGAYGGLRLVEHLMAAGRASKGWVVESWGGISPSVHLCQTLSGVPPQFRGQIDIDTVLQADYGQHPRPAPVPIPDPTPTPAEDDPMGFILATTTVTIPSTPTIWVGPWGFIKLKDTPSVAAVEALGVPVHQVPAQLITSALNP